MAQRDGTERRGFSSARFVSIVGGFSGFLFGMDTGVISGALPLIKQQMHITNPWLNGSIVGALLLGAFFGCIISSVLSRYHGRKVTIVISAFLFAACALLCAFAPSVIFLIVVRFILGIALGMASYITPMYLAEISTRQKRGATIAVYQLMITIGILVAFLSDALFAQMASWRWMLGIVALPAFFLLFMARRLPKSPRWLVLMSRLTEAKAVLKTLLAPADVDLEFNAIQQSVLATHQKVQAEPGTKRGWHLFACLLLLGIGLQLIQQWTGINAVFYYAPAIFKSTGFADLSSQMWCAVITGLVNVIATVIAIKLIDRIGRRPVLYIGLVSMIIALLMLAWVMGHPSHSSALSLLGVGSVMFYIFGFAISLGPVVWILCAEIFPLRFRDVGVMCTTAANWIFNFLLSLSFLPMIQHWSIDKVFLGFMVMSLLGVLLVRLFVPETKNVSLEQIQENVYKGLKLRNLGCRSK